MSQPSVFVGTQQGLFRLQNGKREQLAEGHFTALVRDGSQWWAVLEGRELKRSDDGVRWNHAGKLEGLQPTALLPTAAGLLVGTSGAHLYAFQEGRLAALPSFDTAPGRGGWFNPAASRPDVRSLSQAPSGALFVNVHVGGILRSEDEGKTWTPTLDVHADVHQVLFDAGSKRLLAAAGRGFAASDDQGLHWEFETRGLHASYLRAIAVAGDTVLVTASTGPFSRNAAVYRKPVRGHAPFERCEQGLPRSFPENIDTFWLGASGPAVAFGTSSGHLYLSLDEGARWSLVTEELPAIQCVVLA
ncbi:MAG TPA: hypothetical protein VNA24_21300 [Hyalangium sp.]|nr:hypothetical protein [Hyalangium sp.]